jgi:hypothetical protein
MAIFAPGMTAPVWSMTRPSIEPVTVWADVEM